MVMLPVHIARSQTQRNHKENGITQHFMKVNLARFSMPKSEKRVKNKFSARRSGAGRYAYMELSPDALVARIPEIESSSNAVNFQTKRHFFGHTRI